MIKFEEFPILGDIVITSCNIRNKVPGNEELQVGGVDDGDDGLLLLDLVVLLASSVTGHRQPR